MLRNTRQSWGAVAITLHWVVAGLILAQFILGWVAVAWRLSPTKLDLFVWHKSLGILVLFLVLVRLGWRLGNPAPVFPHHVTHWERRAARASHFSLYLLMLAMSLSGWVIHSAANIPLRLFWLLPLPDITRPDKELQALAETVHLWLFAALALLVALHIGAALRHHLLLHDDLLLRMLPGKRRVR